MSLRPYLPSAQFTLIALSIALSAGLVYAAERVTAPETPSIASVATDSISDDTASNAEWQATLSSIQGSGSGALPTPPDQNDVDALRKAAQSPNVTDSVSRTLLINLTNAKAQGLGGDIPTQNQLIEDALGQIVPSAAAKTYTKADLEIVADSSAAKRAYGNAIMAVLAKHPGANMQNTLLVVGEATDGDNAAKLTALKPIEAEYRALTADLVATPVPQTLSPFHLELVNKFAALSATYPAMESTLTDPLRGLSALQEYRSLGAEATQVFINIAQALTKGDILWSKDEPGASWASLLSTQ